MPSEYIIFSTGLSSSEVWVGSGITSFAHLLGWRLKQVVVSFGLSIKGFGLLESHTELSLSPVSGTLLGATCIATHISKVLSTLVTTQNLLPFQLLRHLLFKHLQVVFLLFRRAKRRNPKISSL